MCILQQAILQKALPLHCLRYTHACRLQLDKWNISKIRCLACAIPMHVDCNTNARRTLTGLNTCTIPVHVDCNFLEYRHQLREIILHYTRACRLQLQKHKYRRHTGLISYALTLSSVSTIRKNYVFTMYFLDLRTPSRPD